MNVEDIVRETSYHKRKVYRYIENAKDSIRYNDEFNMRMMMAEMLIIQQTFAVNTTPRLKWGLTVTQ